METPNIIRYQGEMENSVLVYKAALTDFNKPTILVVAESQRALLYSDGAAEGPFPAGKFLLPTNNFVTFREKFARLFKSKKDKYMDGSVPFTCDVFFVNMVNDFTIAWGTPNPITVEDPKYHLILGVRSNGDIKLKVIDPVKFVVGMVGQLKEYTLDMIKRTVKSDLMPILTSAISRTINEGSVSILEINGKLVELGNATLIALNKRLSDFGLEALHLNIGLLEAPPSDLESLKRAKEQYMKAVNDIDIEAMRKTRMAEAEAQARRVQGYSYRDEKEYEIQRASAENERHIVHTGVAAADATGVACAFCSTKLPTNAKFCFMCGKPVAPKNSFCPTCGHQVTGSSKFCPQCGAKLADAKAHCSYCNAELAEGVMFCPSCGKRR